MACAEWTIIIYDKTWQNVLYPGTWADACTRTLNEYLTENTSGVEYVSDTIWWQPIDWTQQTYYIITTYWVQSTATLYDVTPEPIPTNPTLQINLKWYINWNNRWSR